ncbi:MAG: nuclear transport factor 2 family protein [Gammaproteobacteria bacterium]|nr:nuclear transport factor 2 family protein [Gammaproteobacteria bacterium]
MNHAYGRGIAAVAALALAVLLQGCMSAGVTAADLDRSYEAALAASEPHAVTGLDQDPERLAAALARAESYFRDITPESVRALTRETYAPEAYLNDTLAAISTAEAIEEYFYETAQRADAVRVEFLSHAVSGIDVYVRWRMTIEASRLSSEPLSSYGMSQFRFDDQNRLLIHKDFWDSGGGFFEHLPVIGRAIRNIRGRI